jgi:hypothetical protein
MSGYLGILQRANTNKVFGLMNLIYVNKDNKKVKKRINNVNSESDVIIKIR